MNYAKQYFDNHSAVGVLYFTSDKLAFFEEQNALNHAAHLDDTTVQEVTREEVEAMFEGLELDETDGLDEE